LEGPDQETIDQIVRLSIRYGIVTPYTSYLVTEEMPIGAAAQDVIAQDAYEALKAAPAEVSGQNAVRQAADEGAMAGAESVLAPLAEAANQVKVVGSHTFVFADRTWTDTAYDPESMQTVKVPFLSEDYFALAQSREELGAAFALGERVIALSGSVAYEVVGAEEPVAPIQLPEVEEQDPIEEKPAAPTEMPSVSATPTEQPTPPKIEICGVGLLPTGMVILVVGWLMFWKRLG
jgi:Ca-activated chloride channel family protein